jgi:hypothetical protein
MTCCHNWTPRCRRVLRPYGGLFAGLCLSSVPLPLAVEDVFAGPIQFPVVPENPLVIIALPDGRARGAAQVVDPLRGVGFVRADDRAQ